MLWLIQETIVFVELASLCKNPIKPSLLYSKANQGNIFQSKTLIFGNGKVMVTINGLTGFQKMLLLFGFLIILSNHIK